MSNGWIKVHRQFLDWEWYDDINTRIVFLHCLLKANWKDNKWHGIPIPRGSFISSYSNLAEETDLTVAKVRRAIFNLKSTSEITSIATSKYTMLTICEYDTYQSVDAEDNSNNSGETAAIMTDGQQTNNKQTTTTKEREEYKERKEGKKRGSFVPPTVEEVVTYFKTNGYDEEIATRAFNHYDAGNWHDAKGNKVLNWKQKVRTNWMKDDGKIGASKSAPKMINGWMDYTGWNDEDYDKSWRKDVPMKTPITSPKGEHYLRSQFGLEPL